MKQNNNKSAFSLIELSVILIIIGLIVTMTMSSNLFTASRLSSATVLTKKSPVNFTDGVVMWLETTLEDGFENNENTDGSSVTLWKNIYPENLDTDVTSSGGNAPIYITDGINDLPAIQFDGSDDYMISSNNYHLSSKTEFSTFVVFSPDLEQSENFGRVWRWGEAGNNSRISLTVGSTGVSNDDILLLLEDGTNSHISTVPDLLTTDDSYILSTIFHGGGATDADKYKLYLNNVQITVPAFSNAPLGATTANDTQPFSIGGNGGEEMAGKIGEIIIINKAISEKRRLEIYNYLSQKWNIN